MRDAKHGIEALRRTGISHRNEDASGGAEPLDRAFRIDAAEPIGTRRRRVDVDVEAGPQERVLGPLAQRVDAAYGLGCEIALWVACGKVREPGRVAAEAAFAQELHIAGGAGGKRTPIEVPEEGFVGCRGSEPSGLIEERGFDVWTQLFDQPGVSEFLREGSEAFERGTRAEPYELEARACFEGMAGSGMLTEELVISARGVLIERAAPVAVRARDTDEH